jgi:hypothetical protein
MPLRRAARPTARDHLGTIHDYLSALWRGSGLRYDLANATQEVFVECFRTGGTLKAEG